MRVPCGPHTKSSPARPASTMRTRPATAQCDPCALGLAGFPWSTAPRPCSVVAMTTEITTLTTSEAAARVGLSHQYMRVLLGQGKGPKGTREGKGGRGGWRFESSAVDAWDAARVKRAAKGSKKGLTQEQHDAATAMDPAKLERLEAAGWKAGSAEDFLGTGDAADANPTGLTVLAT